MKKRLLTCVMVITLIFSLCACGGGNAATNEKAENSVDKNSASTYVGDWYQSVKSNRITYHFIKGGSGYYEQSTNEGARWDFTWEVSDEVLTTTRTFQGTTIVESFELTEDGKLQSFQNSDRLLKREE